MCSSFFNVQKGGQIMNKIGRAISGSAFIIVGSVNILIGLFITLGADVTISKED